jgi:hypothetical protein
MTIQRLDNVAIVVEDLDAAAFFTELGMELEGRGQVEGPWADRTVELDGVRSEIAMMRTPDGHSKLELTKYHAPAAVGAEPQNPPPNTLGLLPVAHLLAGCGTAGLPPAEVAQSRGSRPAGSSSRPCRQAAAW